MVRARANRVVMSQRDVRQTTQPEPCQPEVNHNVRSTVFCSWCRANGRQYACLAECSHASCLEPDCCVSTQDWASSAMNSEGWVPASGPCCEDCLEAAFEQRRRSEVGRLGAHLVEEVQGWCAVKGDQVRHSVQKGWKILCQWLEHARQRWRPHNENVKVSWDEVTFEAEGFLEVKVVVSRQGVMQHMEVDFPSQVPLIQLMEELATLIDVPAERQQWFFQAQPMDDSKTLEEQGVDIGAILEVKCPT